MDNEINRIANSIEMTESKGGVVQAEPLNGRTEKYYDCLLDFDSPNMRVKSFINQVIQGIDIADCISKIDKETEYVVRVPLNLKNAYDEGKIFIAQNKDTGVLRPILAKWNENGKYEFVSPMEMIEKTTINEFASFQNIAARCQNIIVQQQLAQLSALMEETYKIVYRIEQGQYDDRIGMLHAGRDQIMLAILDPANIDINGLSNGRNNI